MPNKLLIINLIKYFPMGTLGICDYLNKQGIQTKLLNIPLLTLGYQHLTNDFYNNISKYINLFRPTHIALILHWKENYLYFVSAGEYLKKFHPDLKIICGGFTAGYFGESLLRQHHFIDYLIYGDPEYSLLQLLENKNSNNIPNLIYRDDKKIITSNTAFFADDAFLSEISYTNLDYLFEPEQYIEIINKDLGFPLFLGRGCRYNCLYCGASNNAYNRHSKCTKITKKSINSVISDLLNLKKYTNYIYIGYENDLNYLKELFKAFNSNPDLKKYFNLVYCTWSLPDKELLLLIKEFVSSDNPERNQIEISPELLDENKRKVIRDPAIFFTNQQLYESINFIHELFGKTIKISLFFSRYHQTQENYTDLITELKNLIEFRNLFSKKIIFLYDHIATDVGSEYWETHIKNPKEINTFFHYLNKTNIIAKKYNLKLSNFCCFYFPQNIPIEDIAKFEKLVRLDKYLYHQGQTEENIKKLGLSGYLGYLNQQL